MKKINSCSHAQTIRRQAAQGKYDKDFESHIAECTECRKMKEVIEWMCTFAKETTPPLTLPAPGLILFKAKLAEKQLAPTRAVRLIVRTQIASALIVALAMGWLLLKNQMQIGSLIKATLNSFLSAAPVLLAAVISAVLLCLIFAFYLHKTKDFKK